MKQLRFVGWLVLVAAFAALVAMNGESARFNFWPRGAGYLHFDWPVGFTALVFFLAGFVPPWLIGRVRRWRLKRRLATLESSLIDLARGYGQPPAPDAAAAPPQPGPASANPPASAGVSTTTDPILHSTGPAL